MGLVLPLVSWNNAPFFIPEGLTFPLKTPKLIVDIASVVLIGAASSAKNLSISSDAIFISIEEWSLYLASSMKDGALFRKNRKRRI